MKVHMKQLLLILIVAQFITSCDSPMRTRTPVNYVTSENSTAPGTTPAPGVTPTPGTSPSPSPSPSTTPGFENCDISTKYNLPTIGAFGFCASTADKRTFRFRGSSTQAEATCFIPIYKESNTGNSTYIGMPQCTTARLDTTKTGSFVIDRPGFQNLLPNGAMVMQYGLLPSYYNCMNGYINWLQQACPNGPYTSAYCANVVPRCPAGGNTNASCDQAAKQYMNQVCSEFKNTYSNAFVQIDF